MVCKMVQSHKWLVLTIVSFTLLFFANMQVSAAAQLEDGEYTINYEILQGDTSNNSTSLADGYWDKPAKIIVKNGTINVRTTINKHAWVTELSTKYSGSFSDAKVISVNEKNDSRVVEFKVSSLDDILDAKMSVYVPDIDYDHSYSVRFKFYTDTLKLTSAATTQAPTVTATAKPSETVTPSKAPTTKAPTATVKPEQTVATSKPVTNKETTSNVQSAQDDQTTKVDADKVEGNTASSTGAQQPEDVAIASEPAKNSEVEANGNDSQASVEADQNAEISEGAGEGAKAESSSDFPAGEEVNFTVDKEEKAGGTAAFIIIIIVAVLFIAGAVTWYVVKNKRNK